MFQDIVEMLIGYTIKIGLALLILSLGWLVGRLVGFMIGSVVRKASLVPAFRKVSVGRAILRAGYTPSSFLSTVGRAVIYLVAILSALNALSVPILTAAVQGFLDYVPSLVGGILILVAGLILADLVGESVEKGSSLTIPPRLFGGLLRMLLYFIVLAIALPQMKIDVTILYIFAQALAWGLAIAIGIALGWHLKNMVGSWIEDMVAGESRKADGS